MSSPSPPTISAGGRGTGKPPATQPAAMGATIVGSVLDEPGGKRARGVEVTLWLDGKVIDKTVTVEDGTYKFAGVRYAGMAHAVRVGKHGPGVWTEDALVFVDKTQTSGDIRAIDMHLKLPSLSGTVTDADTGKPVSGVGINFSTINNREAVVTDEKGRYRLYVLPRKVDLYCNGTYDRYYPVIIPGKQVIVKVIVKAGQDVAGIDFTVRSAKPFSGRMLMPDGKPAANLSVLAMVRWSNSTVTDAKRIAEARTRREARIKAGAEKPPVETDENPGGRVFKTFPGGTGSDFRLKTDARGRFLGYLRRHRGSNRDEAIDIVLIPRSVDKALSAFKVIQFTTIDPPPKPVSITLTKSAAVEFEIFNPDGRPVANAKPRARSWLFGYMNMGCDISQVEPDFVNLGRGRYKATGLVPQWDYCLRADAEGYRCRTELKVMAKPGEQVDAGRLVLDWWGVKAIPGLVEKLKDKNQSVRSSACHELAELGPVAAEAVSALTKLLNADIKTDRYSAANAAAALGKIGPAAKAAVPDLIQTLESDKLAWPRLEAAKALGLIGPAAKVAVPALIRALQKDSEADVRVQAARSLGLLEEARSLQALKDALGDKDHRVRIMALKGMERLIFRKRDPGIDTFLSLEPLLMDNRAVDFALRIIEAPGHERVAMVMEGMRDGHTPLRNILHFLNALKGRNSKRFKTAEDALAWWWRFPLDTPVARSVDLDARQLKALWDELSGKEGLKAYHATRRMATGGQSSIAFVAERLKPVSADARQIKALIAQLNDSKYAVRQNASAQLSRLGRAAEAALREALGTMKSLEVRKRLKILLDACALTYPATPEARRTARAMRVLELIGTQQAVEVLKNLAQGDAKALVTEQAKATLQRMKQKHNSGRGKPATRPGGVSVEQLQGLWESLGAKDYEKGHEAARSLAAGGDKAVSFIRERVKPAVRGRGDVDPLVRRYKTGAFVPRSGGAGGR